MTFEGMHIKSRLSYVEKNMPRPKYEKKREE